MCVGGGGVEEAQKGLNGNSVKSCVTLFYIAPPHSPLPVSLKRITVYVSTVQLCPCVSMHICKCAFSYTLFDYAFV